MSSTWKLVARAREAAGCVVGRGWEDLGEITLAITDDGLYLQRAAVTSAEITRRLLPVCGVSESAHIDDAGDGNWRVTLELAGRACWPLEVYCDNAAHAKQWTELLPPDISPPWLSPLPIAISDREILCGLLLHLPIS